MKVSTKSWHYRLLEYYHFECPPNLCPYFWKVVATVVFTPLILLGIGIREIIDGLNSRRRPKSEKKEKEWKPTSVRTRFLHRLIPAIGLFIYGVVIYLYFDNEWYWAFSGFFVYTGGWILSILYMIYWRKNLLQELKPETYLNERKKPKKKEPNIAWEYIKAKKHKYCPVLEFVDPLEEEQLR